MNGIEDFADAERLARVAHRYYHEGQTQAQIAAGLGVSRPTVQRLLQRARAEGMVDIRIAVPPGLHLDLETSLRGRFSLVDAIVTDGAADPIVSRENAARAAAMCLQDRLVAGMTVAVGHGRDTSEVARFVRPDRPVACTFVSAMGGSPRADAPTNPDDIGRALALATGGRAVALFAPAYVESAELRDRLRAQEAVAAALAVAAVAEIAVVGIGGVDDGCTMVRAGCIPPAEIARLRSVGAVGDVLGNYVDREGRTVPSPYRDRLIGLSLDDLRRIPLVIAVASEPEKPAAIAGVLRAGVVDIVVVDEDNARAALGSAHAGDPSAAGASTGPAGGGDRSVGP
ncbi:MAG: MarR family transcriptional regulator [Chloroflexi bacterium]|nr:MarR family transcriptional regulator [Chloroflexota bacterium]